MPSCKIRRLIHKLTISVIAVGLANGVFLSPLWAKNDQQASLLDSPSARVIVSDDLAKGDAKLMGCETCQVAIVGMSRIVEKEMLFRGACLDSSVHTLIPSERLPSARRSGRSCNSTNRVEK